MAGETRYIGWSAADSDYVCTGTNDHTKINEALAWAASNPGNTVYLRGPYTYDIQASLLIGSYTTFKGDSTAVLRLNNALMWAVGIPVIGQRGSGGTLSPGTQSKTIEISGFQINANESHLYHDGVGSPERIHGKGYYNIIHIKGTTSARCSDIHVHHMTLFDGMGDGVRVENAGNVRVHDCDMHNLQHCSIYLVDCIGGEVWGNDIDHITTSALRLDNCQDFDVHNEDYADWTGTTNAYKGGSHAIQIGNQPESYGHTTLTKNINIFNNNLKGGGCGICFYDAYRKAGATAQTVHVYNNNIHDSGSGGVAYFGGIGIYAWGNGLLVEYNTITANQNAGIVAYGSIASGVSATFKNNNIVNSAKMGSVGGYGIWNKVPSLMSIVSENNYFNNNVSGNYQSVTPVSESKTYITETMPDQGTTSDDIDTPSGNITIPTIPVLQNDSENEYHITGRSGYIGEKPFQWLNKKVDVDRAYSQQKPPGVVGWAIDDLGMEGAELTFDCQAPKMLEMHEALAAFYKPGRINIELGGDYDGWKVSGLGVNHTTDIRLKSVIPRNAHPYSLLVLMDEPYYKTEDIRFRSVYCYGNMQFNADNVFKGNLVQNSSFEDFPTQMSLIWELQETAADNEWTKIRYAKELIQFCAVAKTGTDNRVQISPDAKNWRLPYGLTNANRNNDWETLSWCSDWILWAVFSSNGINNVCMVSANGDDWIQKTTPTAANGNSWKGSLYIPKGTYGEFLVTSDGKAVFAKDGKYLTFSEGDSGLPNGRLLVFASSGTNRVMYTDDECENFTLVVSAAETAEWIDGAYSPQLKRIVVIAYTGQIQYSDDYGENWTLATTPETRKLTSIVWADALGLFVVSCEDGTKQIMTSPTGLSGSWTMRETPYSTSTTTGGTVATPLNPGITPTGYNYTTLKTSYMWQYTFVLPALTAGHIYRIDKLYGQLRSLNSVATASLKVTIQAASLYSGAETTITEWTEKNTAYQPKTFNTAIESASGETVTIKFYIKTSNASYKAGATLLGYEATELSAGGTTITYVRNQLTSLSWANEIKLLTCVAKTGTGDRAIYSFDAESWLPCADVPDLTWSSSVYAGDQNTFAAVAKSGTGSRAMTAEDFGQIKNVAPNSWTKESNGQSRSEMIAYDGLHSLMIEGDGVTESSGITKQKLIFAAGTRYILTGFGYVENLTAGSLRADIFSQNSIVKELIWDADTDWKAKNISFKFDVAPTDAYIRVRGYGLNDGAKVYFDKCNVQPARDFELIQTGADIATYGTVDVTPDIIITGVPANPDSTTVGETITDTTDNGVSFTSAATAYNSTNTSLELTVTLPALSSGAFYRLDKVAAKLKTRHAGTVAYLKVTIQAASLYGGVETKIAEWTESTATYQPKTQTLSIVSATNEKVIIRYYMKTSNASYRADATELYYLGAKVTSASGSGTVTENLSIYNLADTGTVMTCLNKLFCGYEQEINADGTGGLTHTDNFTSDDFKDIAYASSGVSWDAENNTAVIGANGYITFVYDTKFPVQGVPYIDIFTKSGNPQIWIAEDVSGAPGTFYAVDMNLSTDPGEGEMFRYLDNENNLRLQSKTKYYVKITPATSAGCEFGRLLEHADFSAIDVRRVKIIANRKANTFAVNVSGKCSCVITLRYPDQIVAV